MWKKLSALKPQSRKLIVMLISVAAYLANDFTGRHVTQETMLTCLGFVGAWMLSQGIADHGSQGAALATQRAIKAGGGMADAVISAVSTVRSVPSVPPQPADGVDGPQWHETAQVDAEDASLVDDEERSDAEGPVAGR
jgi:hypothetical protein